MVDELFELVGERNVHRRHGSRLAVHSWIGKNWQEVQEGRKSDSLTVVLRDSSATPLLPQRAGRPGGGRGLHSFRRWGGENDALFPLRSQPGLRWIRVVLRGLARESPSRLRVAVLGGFLCLVGPGVAVSQPESEEVFQRLIVTERTVFVDDSVLPRMDSAFRRSRADLLVRIDGAPAELVESAAEEPPIVTYLVWLDSSLASRGSLAAAATELASAFPSFPETETFTLVEVDGQAPPLQESVSRSQLVERLQRFAARATTTTEPVPTLARRLAALDRMAVAVSRYRSSDLGALWLAAEPWAVAPGVFEEISRTGAEEALAATPLGGLQRASRILASYGWVLFPVWAKRGGPHRRAPNSRPRKSPRVGSSWKAGWDSRRGTTARSSTSGSGSSALAAGTCVRGRASTSRARWISPRRSDSSRWR